MATYIPSTPSLGERIGSALGTGLGQGIANIAEHKLKQIQTKRDTDTRKDQLKKIGMSDAEADFFADKDPETQYAAMRETIMRGMKGNEQVVDDWIPSSPEEFQKADALRQENIAAQKQGATGISQALQQPAQEVVPKPGLADRLKQAGAVPQEQRKPRKDFEGLTLRTPAEIKAGTKGAEALSKEERVDVRSADKANQHLYDKIIEEKKSSAEIKDTTDRMLKLVEKGKLPSATMYKLLKNAEESAPGLSGAGILAGAGAAAGGAAGTLLGGVGAVPLAAAGGLIGGAMGLVLGPLATLARYDQKQAFPDIEEFEKLSAGFIKGAKVIFGSRVTDNDLKAFMETVPTLMNTENGKKAIIRNIQIMNEASVLRYNAMKEIIKENGGHRPINMALDIEERIAEDLDRLSQDFVAGIKSGS